MLETNNMYYAAFLMTEGLTISNILLADNDKLGKIVSFSFSCEDKEFERRLESAYMNEKAVTNIRKYLDSLIAVRDIIHKMYENKERTGRIGKNNAGKRYRKTEAPY